MVIEEQLGSPPRQTLTNRSLYRWSTHLDSERSQCPHSQSSAGLTLLVMLQLEIPVESIWYGLGPGAKNSMNIGLKDHINLWYVQEYWSPWMQYSCSYVLGPPAAH